MGLKGGSSWCLVCLTLLLPHAPLWVEITG
ncbi:unnamed protein product [Linum tenue]|uniref:Uncharacterized protein n=2 Tax=Linum tenue TaxID=586396 RepID=A0AAV0L1A3_9ROSI|nr:unnamed protein product [Linum tenue]CAI0428455.1 unnamed protein product [Linum tenue]